MEINSKQINIVAQSTVQKHVEIEQSQDCHICAKIKSIRYIGKQDVYNMEVKDHHNFSVNGGLIVHNSIDSVRYSQEENINARKIKYLK